MNAKLSIKYAWIIHSVWIEERWSIERTNKNKLSSILGSAIDVFRWIVSFRWRAIKSKILTEKYLLQIEFQVGR